MSNTSIAQNRLEVDKTETRGPTRLNRLLEG